MRRAPLLLAAAVALAGCGGTSSAPFLPGPTAKCLSGKGFRVSRSDKDVGFVASAAVNGGLRAVPPDGNAVTIAFGADGPDATQHLVPAFRRFASPQYRRHFADIFEQRRNAVLIWTVAPGAQTLQTAMSCLRT